MIFDFYNFFYTSNQNFHFIKNADFKNTQNVCLYYEHFDKFLFGLHKYLGSFRSHVFHYESLLTMLPDAVVPKHSYWIITPKMGKSIFQ